MTSASNNFHLPSGILFYVMGPSGSGKDTLLSYLRSHRPTGVIFAHRYITRGADSSGEVHIPVDEEEFLERRAHGLFCLSWQAHDLAYAIGLEVEIWLQRGLHVVMNGSRAAFAQAQASFARCQGILIQADPDLVRKRLRARGREDAAQVAKRLERAAAFAVQDQGIITLANNGPPEQAGQTLVEIIEDRIASVRMGQKRVFTT